ncbi:MAG: hypothetical protein KDB90_11480 [Planctomycetes bacterium]|nr:hypothetical protein [Planctomycetota bacterium]
MDADFGQLVDFLRGELDKSAAAEMRARLEAEPALFDLFERLRHTYAVLRSMPKIGQAKAPVLGDVKAPETIPLTTPREEFVRDVNREFNTRGWIGLIPYITARPEFVGALRVEFSVRAICASLPQLIVSASLLEALRLEFAARTRIDSLPFIKARPDWIRALREEFAVRAVVASLPQLAPRPEFVAALRAEFAGRSLVSSLPQMDVREGFERRLKVALVESSREVEVAEPATSLKSESLLPAVDASDPFRRRLFKNILLSSRRRVRDVPKRVDVEEYQWGREIKRGMQGSRKSLVFTLALHAVVIAVLLFVFVSPPTSNASPFIAQGATSQYATPAMPGAQVGNDAAVRTNREYPILPGGEDWNSYGAAPPVGTGGTQTPPREHYEHNDTAPPPPDHVNGDEQAVAGYVDRDNVSSFFRLRGASRQQKIDYLGSAELYDALDKTLALLAKLQQLTPEADGSWGYVNVDPRIISQNPDLREVQKLEMTCTSVLAFLGDGHSSEKSPLGYDYTVNRGISWILKQQRDSGQIGPPAKGNVLVHAMATLALAEDFGMTRAPRLREPLRNACRWLCSVHATVKIDEKTTEESGGFPFLLGKEASMSTTVWGYMALATARNVKVPPIDLPQQRIDELMEWYKAQTRGTVALADTPVLGNELLANSAAAGMSLFATETDFENRASTYLSKINRELPNLTPPASPNDIDSSRDNGDMRYLFFGSLSQALNDQRNGRKSKEWYGAFAKTLLANQKTDGSWTASSQYFVLYGDVYSAAMAGLSIENAYRVSILSK